MILLLGWLATALAGVTVSLPASDAEVELDDSAAAAVEQGMQALTSGRFDDAGRAFHALSEAGADPVAHYLEALAWYEGGRLRSARTAVDALLAASPSHGPGLALLGLIQADAGRGEEAMATLKRAAGVAGADRRLKAQIALNRGLVLMDQGSLAQARASFETSASIAAEVGDDATAKVARENLGTLAALTGAGGQGGDEISTVVARLRAGDVAGARKSVPNPAKSDRRGAVRALLADALVDRAEGGFDAANVKVRTALGMAREGGLVRETAACLAELGTLYSLSGRFDTSLQLHQEAVGLVADTSFRLREVGYRVEAGRVAVRLGDLRQARNQLDAAEAVAARTEDPVGQARIRELRGQIFAREDKVSEAAAKLESALSTYQKRGHRADEARVATDLVSLWAGKDEGLKKKWSSRAIQAFAAIGNQAGPAHVQVAAGLGFARRLDLDSALAAFLEAARLSEALDTDRGRQIATHARENAAQALKALGHTDALADEMATATDLEGVMAQQAAFAVAERSYQKGLEVYNRGEYAAAHASFDSAVKAFVKIGETGHANTSRKGRGWASRGIALRAEPADALPRFESALRDATAAGDAELRVKAQVGAALSAADLERKDAAKRLTVAADLAERGGYKDEAGLCLARLAQVAEGFATRAAAARRAVDLRGTGDTESAYAMYSVAVDAFNDGDLELALELAEEIAPYAGTLSDAVEQVRAAAQEQLQDR